MTVKELKELTKNLPDNAEVKIVYNNEYGQKKEAKIKGAETVKKSLEVKVYVPCM